MWNDNPIAAASLGNGDGAIPELPENMQDIEHKDSGTEVVVPRVRGQHEGAGATAGVEEDHTVKMSHCRSTTISVAALCFNIVVLAFYFGMHCTPMVDVSSVESAEALNE